MQYDKGLAKKTILKKETIPTVYGANVNMTHPPPITSARVSVSMRPVIQKREVHRVYPETQTESYIDEETK